MSDPDVNVGTFVTVPTVTAGNDRAQCRDQVISSPASIAGYALAHGWQHRSNNAEGAGAWR